VAAGTDVAGASAFVGVAFSTWVSTARVGARGGAGGGSVGVARRVGAAGAVAFVELAAPPELVA
jgi:hypothetical protein